MVLGCSGCVSLVLGGLMALGRQLAYSFLVLAGSSGLGLLLWVVAAPGEERKKEILRHLPESNPARMAEKQRQNALILEAIKAAAETKENVTYRAPWKK
ncbi:ubiquinol-cytochrome-c reductase complex assembly factor 3 [Rhinatrema bivittatum]|uniref:ubiquinol-cytochrome-c reductase complex assembly factor 3 n=1 Tax=Rhinatrema bivittatum TaxID=194408 RepID=UPI00112616D9|nr:ubiquinol-cytochrome-c reductase complex assembly factor 3 [Rhinatrema bivittatum]